MLNASMPARDHTLKSWPNRDELCAFAETDPIGRTLRLRIHVVIGHRSRLDCRRVLRKKAVAFFMGSPSLLFNNHLSYSPPQTEKTGKCEKRKASSGDERPLWTRCIPEGASDDARRKHGDPRQQIEKSVGRSTQFWWRRIGNRCREQPLRKAHVQTP